MTYKKKDTDNSTKSTDNVAVENDASINETPVKTVERVVEKIIEKPITYEDTRLDKKVTVRSIAPWITGAPRHTTNGDISIPPKGTVLLSREEIIAQAQNGNTLLNGIDSLGSHATWYIEDDFTRSELSFDIPNENKKQAFLTKNSVKKMFDKKQDDFEQAIMNNVVIRAEKAYLIECIKELGINDYRKVDFCVKYTGINP